jgi:hypothetical protein
VGFRDDREASIQRVDTLERELASTKDEREAARLRAAEVDDLRTRLTELTAERDALRGGMEPPASPWDWRRWAAVTALAVVVVVVAVSGYVSYAQRVGELTRAEQFCRSNLESCHEQASWHGRIEERLRHAPVFDDRVVGPRAPARLERVVGPALLITAHVVRREGDVPSDATDHCLIAIRELAAPVTDAPYRYATCSVVALCGSASVFPASDPAPGVRCLGSSTVWAMGGQPLLTARADAPGEATSLFRFDARDGEVEIEAPGAGWHLTLRVEETFSSYVPLEPAPLTQ